MNDNDDCSLVFGDVFSDADLGRIADDVMLIIGLHSLVGGIRDDARAQGAAQFIAYAAVKYGEQLGVPAHEQLMYLRNSLLQDAAKRGDA